MQQADAPRVSILMPAYNAERFIGAAIESVIAQTFLDWELIVVDDASTDDTFRCVQSYQQQDARICYLRNERNLGAAGSRNRALDAARGRYIAFLDSDDLWLPHKLTAQLEFMEVSGTLITYGDYLRVDEFNQPLGWVHAPRRIRYCDMLKSNFIGNLTGIYRRDGLPELRFAAGGHEDYLFWLRALQSVGAIQATPSPEPLARYRVLTGSLSADKFQAMRWQWRIYRDELGFSTLSSAYYFMFYIYHALRKRTGLAAH